MISIGRYKRKHSSDKVIRARAKQNLMAQALIDQSDLDWYRQQAPLDVDGLISAIDMMTDERTTNNGYSR